MTTTDPSGELPVAVAQERLPHSNPHTCARCTANRAALRLTLADGSQVTVCGSHAAGYPRASALAADQPEVLTRSASPRRSSGPAAPASSAAAMGTVYPDGPGRVAPGQRVTCLPGSLPAREGGRGGGVLVSIGPKTSVVDVYGGARRRIPNELLHPEAGPHVAGERAARGLRTATADGRDWLPRWSWLGWSVAQHLEYQQGIRQLPTPPPAPQRLIVVACGARKADCFEAPASEMYIGSYHRAARRAADAISTPGARVVILSALYGLLDPADRILRYEMRLGHRLAITAQGLQEQAEQLGLLDTAQVIVLAPAAYANLAAQVWPHAHLALAGTRGIGDQMARFAALAAGRATIATLASTEPGVGVSEAIHASGTDDQHAVSVRGGLVHLVRATVGPAGGPDPACRATHRRGGRWRLTDAEITCSQCTAIMLRRRTLHRWCSMVDRTGPSSITPTRTSPTVPPPIRSELRRRTGPAPRRPDTRGRSRSPCHAGRRPGQPARRHDSGRWRHVPARPYRATPLTWTADPAPRHRPRHRSPYRHGPRPSIGRAPPRVRGVGRRAHQAPARPRVDRQPDGFPLIPVTSVTRDNGATRSGSANGLRQPSSCTTRRPAASHPLAEPLRTVSAPGRTQASTNSRTRAAPDRCWRTTRGLDRTPEIRPMTDLTTRPIEPGTSGPALAPAPVNGTAPGDRRTLRHASRAEQERISADAQVERRARAAQLELELHERRHAAARRQRHADEQDKQARRNQRRAHRAARRAQLRATASQWADRALFILPILFPMAVAWVGQIRFAMTVMHWPLPAAVVFAAGFELSTAYVARLDWRARAAGDSGLLFRSATWGFAAGAAIMNYWHAAGPDFAPTGEAVSYGLMSVTGVVLWELLSTYRHRTTLRAEGKLPAARPRYGLARWIWFRPLTRVAWLLALRDGYTTTNTAWQAALAAVDLYGSARGARKAVQAGRPVPRPEPLADEQNKGRDVQDAPRRDIGPEAGDMRDGQEHHADRDITARYPEPDSPERDNIRDPRDRHVTGGETATSPGIGDSATDTTGPTGESSSDETGEPLHTTIGDEPPNGQLDDLLDRSDDQDDATLNRINGKDGHDDAAPENQEPAVADRPTDSARNDNPARFGDGVGERQVVPSNESKGSLITKMKTYARERAAQGVSVTGAELDRRFGTRDYGRKVLRHLAVEPDPDVPGQPQRPQTTSGTSKV